MIFFLGMVAGALFFGINGYCIGKWRGYELGIQARDDLGVVHGDVPRIDPTWRGK